MPSEAEIERAARIGMGWADPRVDEQWRDLLAGNGSDYQVERCRVAMDSARAALTAASAIDGDYNAAVDAARAWHLERAAHYSRQIHDVYDKETFHTEAAKSLEKLKRPS